MYMRYVCGIRMIYRSHISLKIRLLFLFIFMRIWFFRIVLSVSRFRRTQNFITDLQEIFKTSMIVYLSSKITLIYYKTYRLFVQSSTTHHPQHSMRWQKMQSLFPLATGYAAIFDFKSLCAHPSDIIYRQCRWRRSIIPARFYAERGHAVTDRSTEPVLVDRSTPGTATDWSAHHIAVRIECGDFAVALSRLPRSWFSVRPKSPSVIDPFYILCYPSGRELGTRILRYPRTSIDLRLTSRKACISIEDCV